MRALPDVFRRADHDRYELTEAQVRAHVAARRWQRPTPVAVVTHNGPLSLHQHRLVAVLSAGTRTSPAALCAWTALDEHGLTGWERPDVHLLVPRGRSTADLVGPIARVHESRRFEALHVAHRAGMPRTTVERSAIDAAAWSSSDRAACGVLAAVVQQRLSSAARLEAELVAAGHVRRARLLLGALADIGGGAQAVSEMDLLRFCRRHRLPRPLLQAVRYDAAGRRRYLDATFTTAGGRSIRLEVDGALHLAVGSYWDDMRRGNDLALVGETVLRVPSVAIRADDPDLLRQLRTALAR